MFFKINKLILKLIFIANFLIVLLIEIPKCLYLIFRYNKKKFFYQEEGGFGHLISTPMFLNSKYEDDWTLLFSFQKLRFHNDNIKKIFPNKLIFINNGILSNYLGVITPKYYCELPIKVIVFFSKIFFSIDIVKYYDHLFSLNRYEINTNTQYFKGYESRCWKEIVKYSSRFILNNNIKKEISNFDLNFLKKHSGKVLFPIRTKGSNANERDISNKLRDTRDINDYKEILEDLESRNYLIFLSGDKIQYPHWINNSRDIITSNKTGYDEDYFNLIAGISADIVIGGPSGATMFSMMGKKNLFLESWDFGVGFNKTILSHPMIKISGHVELKDILTDRYFETNESFFNSENIKQWSKKELFEIYYEFIENINDENYGVDPKIFGINNGWLIDSKSKISNKWLELIKIKY